MFRELTLENFRGFKALHIGGLGRVNLLVGANNAGKTSVLEAVALAASGGEPAALFQSLNERREYVTDPSDGVIGLDVRQLFWGRKIGDQAALTIQATDKGGAIERYLLTTPRVDAAQWPLWRELLAKLPPYFQPRAEKLGRPEGLLDAGLDLTRSVPRFLELHAADQLLGRYPLMPNGGLLAATFYSPATRPTVPVRFMTTTGLTDTNLTALYDGILLTPEELVVTEALRFLEPQITRLATRQSGGERDFVIGLEGAAGPIPLGSLGEGVRRLLAIILALVSVRGGYLLVDEIDTGLHHTVLRTLWRLVHQTAIRLDVTVFATTHSSDCVHALAEIAQGNSEAEKVALIRVERDQPEAVHFTESEIRHLAEWRVEAR